MVSTNLRKKLKKMPEAPPSQKLKLLLMMPEAQDQASAEALCASHSYLYLPRLFCKLSKHFSSKTSRREPKMGKLKKLDMLVSKVILNT